MSNEVQAIALNESKLYAISRSENLLEMFLPDFEVMFQSSIKLEETSPRTEEDGDATRIFINFTNEKGNSVLYKQIDPLGLNATNPKNIDDFFTRYSSFIGTTTDAADQDFLSDIGRIDLVLAAALSFCLITILNLGDKSTPTETAMAEDILKALIAVVYNNPLDVIIFVNENKVDEDENGAFVSDVKLKYIWAASSR